MNKPYIPELGQAIFGAPTGEFECPTYVEAFVDYIHWLIEITVWNRDQKTWEKYDDPKIPGLEWRPYCWHDGPESELPNFKFGDVEIRWYKHPGRGQTVNVNWTPNQWVEWFDKVTEAVREEDKKSFDGEY